MMNNNSKHPPAVQAGRHGVTGGMRDIGHRVAPAVALLLLGDSAYAQPDEDSGDLIVVSEPTALGLLAAGIAVGGITAYVRNKRRK